MSQRSSRRAPSRNTTRAARSPDTRSPNTTGEDLKALRSQEISIDITHRSAGDLRVHLVYPNTYWVAMSNLGFQAVYGLFGKEDGVVIERGFLPEEVLKGEELKQAPKTFESQHHLHECDVIAFSLSFETDYPHLVKLLAKSGLLFPDHVARDHARDNSSFPTPLIIAGGTSVTLNPEPVADLIDIIVLGEAEELIPELTAVLRQGKSNGLPREEILYSLAQIEGVYVPRFHSPHYLSSGSIKEFVKDPRVPHRPSRRFVKDLSKFPTHTRILTPETEFKSMFLTETGRGCEMGCRFCVAGYIYRPVRKRSEESLKESVELGLKHSDAVGFVGAAVSSHRGIANLAKSVAEKGGRASLSSIMSQKVTKELAGSISESEYKTVALAPEAGSERLRRAAGKRVGNEQVIEAARQLAESGIRGFKLYFIVGLPTETVEDTAASAHLAIQVRDAVTEAAQGEGKRPWVQLSVNPFIPKASTPFQWEPMISKHALEDKIDRIRTLIKREHNIELRFESPKESVFQALLSRGDRRVERRIPFEEPLPWDIVDSKVDKKLLQREAGRAYFGEDFGRSGATEDDTTEVSEEIQQTALFG